MPWLPESPVALAALPLLGLAVLLIAHALSRTAPRVAGRARRDRVGVRRAVRLRRRRPVAARARGCRATPSTTSPTCDQSPSIATSISPTTIRCSAWTTRPTCGSRRPPPATPTRRGRSARRSCGRRSSAAATWRRCGSEPGPARSRPTARRTRIGRRCASPDCSTRCSGRGSRSGRRGSSSRAPIAATGAALVVGGSFILWYALAEPTMTHAPTMAAVAGFVWYWTATMGRRTLLHWLGLGALAGLAGLIRWQSVLFALLPAIEALIDAVARRRAPGTPPTVRVDPRRRRRLHLRRGGRLHPADAGLEGDLRALPGGVAGRAADLLDRSAPGRRPLRVAERPVRDCRRFSTSPPSA